MPGRHQHVAVLGDVHLHRALAAGIVPEAGGHAAAALHARPRRAIQRRAVVRVVLDGLHRFLEGHGAEGRPIDRLVAGLGRILQPHLQRIEAERLRDLVQHALGREGTERRARRAIRRHLRPVRHHVVADRQHIRDRILREGTTHRPAQRRTGQPARLQVEGALRRDDGAVLLRTDLHGGQRPRRRAGRALHFLAPHHHLHRATGLLRQHHRDGFEIDDGLAAEAAADLGGNGADVALRDARQQRRHGAHHELPLGRRPDRHPPIRRVGHGAGMRFDVALVHRARLEGALDDDVGLGEAGLHVAGLEHHGAGDVRRLALELVPLMQDRRVVLDRVLDLDDVGQDLVVHLDQRTGMRGHFLADRRDGGDRMAVEQRLLARHDVAAHPAHVLDAEHHRLVERELDDVVARHHRLHAGQRLGLRRIDRPDARMRVRAAQHLAPHHAGHGVVGAVLRAAGHLVGAVGADRVLADPLGVDDVHQAAPLISAAVSSTARTILS